MAKTRAFQPISATGNVLPFRRDNPAPRRRDRLPVVFERRELDALLYLYGRMVKAGEWRDYALDHLDDTALFSVFRRSQERPVYCVEKLPPRLQRQGAYALYDAGGRMLRRSSSLRLLLCFLEQRVARGAASIRAVRRGAAGTGTG